MDAKIFQNIGPAIKIYKALGVVKKEQKEARKYKASGEFEKEREAIRQANIKWSSYLFENFGVELEIRGQENLPEKGPVLFVSNHQSYADIPIMSYALSKFQFGFIAKEDLKKVPGYGDWMLDLEGLFLTRDNPREALATINEASSLLEKGYSLLIFPEGTRSRGKPMREFKKGALKIATKAGMPIIPVTVSGSYKMFENQGYFRGDKATIVIHPMVETKNLDRHGQNQLAEDVFNTIHECLLELEPEMRVKEEALREAQKAEKEEQTEKLD